MRNHTATLVELDTPVLKHICTSLQNGLKSHEVRNRIITILDTKLGATTTHRWTKDTLPLDDTSLGNRFLCSCTSASLQNELKSHEVRNRIITILDTKLGANTTHRWTQDTLPLDDTSLGNRFLCSSTSASD